LKLLPDAGIIFAQTRVFECAARLRAAESAQRPCRVRTHGGFRFFRNSSREDRHCGWIAAIAERNRAVAQETPPLGSLDRGFTIAAAKALLREAHELAQRRHQFIIDGGRSRRVAVPWAYFLADVTAENPVTDFRTEFA